MTKRKPALRKWLDAQPDKSQRWLAQRLDISDAFMSEILSGKRTPGLSLAVRIEELTGIPARELAAA